MFVLLFFYLNNCSVFRIAIVFFLEILFSDEYQIEDKKDFVFCFNNL